MGFQKFWQITSLKIAITVFLFLLQSMVVESSNTNKQDSQSLDSYVVDKANKEIRHPRTGILYNVTLPSNFSGIEISIVRVRTSSFWSRGLNYSFIHFPPRIIPIPFVKRMAIVYSNMGNWSSDFFNVPNHTIIGPVLGFISYVSSKTSLIDNESGTNLLNLTILGDPITLRFPQNDPKGENNIEKAICANFGENGSVVEFSNMSRPYVCVGEKQGHYALVVPNSTIMASSQEGNKKKWRWVWLGLGILGLVILVICFVVISRIVKKRRIRKMEKNSEGCENFDTFWIGQSRMPAASMTRTQGVLENEHVYY